MYKFFLYILIFILFPTEGIANDCKNQDYIILSDSTSIVTDSTGIKNIERFKTIQVQTITGALSNRIIKEAYDPQTSSAEFRYCTIYRNNGDILNLDVTKACNYTAPFRSSSLRKKEIMLEIGRLYPGDIVEYKIAKKDFTNNLCIETENNVVAEYNNLSKSWFLHPDGGQEYRFCMALLFHTPPDTDFTFHDNIVYNPEYQKLQIHSSYIRLANDTIIPTPENAFIETLPSFAVDAPAYNHLKEMVILYAGLEQEATLFLDYSIISKPDYYPTLDIYEHLQEHFPIKTYNISIFVPEDQQLFWQFHHAEGLSITKQKDKGTDFSFTLQNIPPLHKDSSPLSDSRLNASTYPSCESAIDSLQKRFDNHHLLETEAFAEYITEEAVDDKEKWNIIKQHVLQNMTTVAIPADQVGYRMRNVDTVLRSAYGTVIEKLQLLLVMLNAVGIPSEIAVSYDMSKSCGLKAIKEFIIQSTINGESLFLSLTPDQK